MREISADAWEVDCDVLCITTNCTITSRLGLPVNVMGGGIAREAAQRHPDLPTKYAYMIENHGHHVFLMDGKLLMFPTKNEVSQPSSMARIALSILETKALADIYGWKDIALPRPGCGLGGLDWHGKVKPFFNRDTLDPYYLDHRFIVVSYPGEE